MPSLHGCLPSVTAMVDYRHIELAQGLRRLAQDIDELDLDTDPISGNAWRLVITAEELCQDMQQAEFEAKYLND